MVRSIVIVGATFAALIATVGVLALAEPDGDANENLLINGSFEDGDAGWTVLGGNLTIVEAPLPVPDGARAAQLDVDADQVALNVFQDIPSAAGGTFRLSGLALVADPGVEWLRLQLSWHTPNGAYQEAPSQQINASADGYQHLIADAITVPCDATGVRASIVVRRQSGAAEAHAYADALVLGPMSPAPPCPTTTPSPTASPTVTATPTRTHTAIPTITATSTETPTRTPGPTGIATGTRTPSGTPEPSPTSRTPARSATATASPTEPGPMATPSHELLVNGGFEAAEDGELLGWQTFGGALAQVSSPVRSGAAAACFTSATSSTKWVFQAVAVDPSAWYQLEGHVLQDDPAVAAAWLRISWYGSDDGSGIALATVDSLEELAGPAPEFRPLTTGPVPAPDGAHSAAVRIMLRPGSDATAVICIDDVAFAGSAPPATVTPTASITPSGTPTPTSPLPSATPSAISTGLPTRAAASPTLDARPTRTPTAATRPSATPTSPFAGDDAPIPAAALANGGFEELSGGDVADWRHHGGLLSQVDAPTHGGRFAGALFSSTASTKWLYQTVAVTPLQWYELTAFVADDHPGVEVAWLRVSWYDSADASGSALDSVDSLSALDVPAPGYRELSTGPVQAPPGARSANVRIMLRPRSELSALIYVDDVSFGEVAPPEIPGAEVDALAAGSAGTSQSVAPVAGSPSSGDEITSQVLNAVAMRAPQPTPVVRHRADALLAPNESAKAGDTGADRRWLWPIAAGLLAAGASAMAAYWRGWPLSASEGPA